MPPEQTDTNAMTGRAAGQSGTNNSAAPEPAPPAPSKPAVGVPNVKDILLPRKETPGATVASAQRVNAGALLEQEQLAAQTGTAGQTAPQAAPPAPKPTSPTPPPQSESAVRPLETYKSAIEQVVQQKNVSVVTIAAAEAQRRDKEATPATSKAPRDIGFTIAAVAGGLVLLAAAVGILAYVFLQPQVTAPVAQQQATTPFITVDSTRAVAVPQAFWHRTGVMEALNSAKEATTLSLGLMAQLYLSQTTSATSDVAPPRASIQTFLSAIAPNIPDELVRSFSGEYLLGVHSFDDNQAFLIIGVESYEAAHAGMLAWEWTMPQELAPLFERAVRPRIPEENTATSTPTSTSPQVLQTRFIDRIVENYDARVIQNEYGDILLMWTFLDRSTVVITTNEYTLREIVSRRSRPPVLPI